MTYLIDTHILIWSLFDPGKIKPEIQKILIDKNNTILVSKISLWEISLKYSIGKLELKDILPEKLTGAISKLGFEIKDIEVDEILSFYKLPGSSGHRDPFDRMIIWQCLKNNFTLISRDSRIENYKSIGLDAIY